MRTGSNRLTIAKRPPRSSAFLRKKLLHDLPEGSVAHVLRGAHGREELLYGAVDEVLVHGGFPTPGRRIISGPVASIGDSQFF